MPSLIVRKPVAIAFIVGLLLTGCSSTSEPAPEPVASVEPQFTFFASGTASQNLPIFENVLAVTGAGAPGHDLSESVALLVETGFELETITHTPVDSKIGEPADSVSLAIEFAGECLIAQFSSTWLNVSITEPTLSGCLIGDVEKATLGSK
jgi:hypothetical protein